MKTKNFAIIGCVMVLGVTGCAGPRQAIIDRPAEPDPARVQTKSGEGNLVVLSAWDRFDTLDADHKKHTAYQILSEHGELLRKVRNRAGAFGSDPVSVSLPVGEYKVKALAANAGEVTLRVIIKENRTTTVALDGSVGSGSDYPVAESK